MEKLLERKDFREGVMTRDGHRCVFCRRSAEETPEGKLDAHHIMERRLFTAQEEKGGYFIGNGATVCEDCHMKCETTEFSTEAVREACGITKVILPEHLYESEAYDKWGNIVQPNGQRLRGDLFYDESVQKVLAKGGFLGIFTNRVKYCRTWHTPWSPGMHDDDRAHKDMKVFEGRRVIVSRKMDGENTSIYQDYLHARSIDGRNHPSRAWVKNWAAQFQHQIPDDWRIVVENLYAEHSIRYDALPSYAMGISVWNDRNVCLAWDAASMRTGETDNTMEIFEILGIEPVEVLFDGIYDEVAIKAIYDEKRDWDTHEGYVIRVAESFAYGDFRHSVAKMVRRDHVRTTKHWMQGQRVIPNGIAG